VIVPVALGCQMLSGGGSERQLTEFAKAIDRKRFQPHVIVFRNDEAKAAELHSLHIPVVRIPVHSFASPSIISASLQLRRYFRRHHIRIFHAFDLPLAVAGVPVARLAGVDVVLSSVRGHRELYSHLYRRLVRWTDPLVHGIVVNAQALREHLIRDEGISPDLIHYCPNALDTLRFHPGGRTSAAHPGPLTIGCVCVLREEKNLQLLVRAFAAIPDRAGLRLLLVGSGPMLQPLQALSRDLGIAEQVEFRPATNDVPAVLREIDIFVLPSLSEGLSNALMEAMACGCCVAASAIGGNVELVRAGDSGLLFNPQDPRQLTEVLNRLVGDVSLRGRLASNAALDVAERFSASRSARTMEAIYDGLLTSVS
jgi:glycosyltransferase involved in cell wall biosynthesis